VKEVSSRLGLVSSLSSAVARYRRSAGVAVAGFFSFFLEMGDFREGSFFEAIFIFLH